MNQAPQVRVGLSTLLQDPLTGKYLIGIRTGSHGAHTWHSPGGHLEWMEDWATCYVRELEEETGIVVDPSSVRYLGATNDKMDSESKHYITIHMMATWDQKQTPRRMEQSKCLGWEWHSLEDIRRKLSPLFLPLLNLVRAEHLTVPSTGGQQERIAAHLRGKVNLLLGYPGSGKGTQGKQLSQQLGLPHISTGELYRAEAKTGSSLGKKMDEFMQRGEIIPKEYTFDYLRQELTKHRYRDGFLLDGYPKDLESLEFIKALIEQDLGLEILAALNFSLDRAQVHRRLTGRLFCAACEANFHQHDPSVQPKTQGVCTWCGQQLTPRQDDSPQTINTRLDSFEVSTQPVLERLEALGMLHELDAALPPDALNRAILTIFERLGCPPRRSYWLFEPKEPSRSARWHNHMDAKDDVVLHRLVREVQERCPHAQNKIYPISHLHLGPQIQKPEFKATYERLPNFHPIEDSYSEAFSTGRMGDSIDYEFTLATLNVTAQHHGAGVMTEIEEDLFEMSFDEDGRPQIELDTGDSTSSIDWTKLPSWREKMIKQVPEYELHHGIDIPKLEGELIMPISLERLSRLTSQRGFEHGGWFVFVKEKRWAYRSNEFSNERYSTCLERLKTQAQTLRALVKSLLSRSDSRFTSSCSLEKVHAIWRCD